MKLTLLSRGIILLIFLVSCDNLVPPTELTPTPVPETGTPTQPIIWFPPTNTPTLFPTLVIQSTPEQRPGLGELQFTDNFNQPGLWKISAVPNSSGSVTGNRLILSISGQGPVYVTALRNQPALGNFYAEVTVKLSLCGEKDQFGMIFHASPDNAYYRFTVRCDGQARIEIFRSFSTFPLLDWLSSGDAPTAAPAEVKLGVWVVGGEMRFFLNDHFQFTIKDPVLRAGTLGLFAFAGDKDPITASFSDLSAYSVSYTSPTPSLTPSRTPTSSRTPVPSRTSTP